MKDYTEVKNTNELAKLLKLPKGEAAKIEMRTHLAIAIKKVIRKKEMTHAQAAKQSGMGRTVITAIVNGNTTHISTDRLLDIAAALGLRIRLSVA